MSFKLPPLPWGRNALVPVMSPETIDFHYGKHHAGYVTKLNELSKGTPIEKMTLESIIKTESGKIFNLAAQIWNHTFFWEGMKPGGGGEPTGKIAELIKRDFGSFDNFKKTFSDTANNHFGSGWAWLVQTQEGKLNVYSLSDAGNPMKQGHKPILTLDVWEHAYYIDHRNNRAAFVEGWWKVVNWDFANKNLGAAQL
uniref:Superoxide dismutase n=1 Tax=Arcella intermedia TaxID=1963864 RepID=A0A6B2LKA8_9EUKA|eukprot:TRINITY_DN24126_c0_g1_i1.p1 TRINITY_DN24126_c0_g1~~TRINITY_DN24126_c0_g1_i1.p1  ORF type:complete len:197 (-),score=44.12 TRINITY_DN24126_c0_g1_i1:80-670(-)